MNDAPPTASPPAPHAPRVLGVVVSWNKRGYLERLLRDVTHLKRPPDEILVVDNASSDGTPDMVREQFPQVHLLETGENLGGAGGFNAGMRWGLERGGYDYFWLMDNDIVVHEGALAELLEVAETQHDVGIVGSRIGELESPGRTHEIGVRFDFTTGTIRKLGVDEIVGMPGEHEPLLFEADYAASCSLLARVCAIEQVGIWDARFFVFFDDIEWGLRFVQAGWRVVGASASFVEHESFWERRLFAGFWCLYLNLRNSLYFHHRLCPKGRRARLFFFLFRRILRDWSQYRFDGRAGLANTLWRGVTDFFDNRFGPAPDDLGPDTVPADRLPDGSPALMPQDLPKRKGRILFWTVSSSDQAVAALAALRAAFPEHEVDVFIPEKILEAERTKFDACLEFSTETLAQRLRLGRWILKRYDAVARDYRRPRLPFELLLPMALWWSPGGEIGIMRNRPSHLLRLIAMRPVVYALALGFTVRVLLKPRERVDYFTWDRAEK